VTPVSAFTAHSSSGLKPTSQSPCEIQVSVDRKKHWRTTRRPSTTSLLPTYGGTATPTRRSRRQTTRSLMNSRTEPLIPNQRHDSDSMNSIEVVGLGNTIII